MLARLEGSFLRIPLVYNLSVSVLQELSIYQKKLSLNKISSRML